MFTVVILKRVENTKCNNVNSYCNCTCVSLLITTHQYCKETLRIIIRKSSPINVHRLPTLQPKILNKINNHPNVPANRLLWKTNQYKSLNWFKPTYLATRFK